MFRRGLLISSFLLFALSSSFGSGSPPALKFDKPALITILEIQNKAQLGEVVDRVDQAVNHFSVKITKYKDEADFAEYLYHYVHRKFLRQYSEFSSIDQTISKGKYDCLTATALYSYFFAEMGIPFAVVENNYHIYMLIYPESDKEILIETTDPRYGFVTDTKVIGQLKVDYAKGNYRSSAKVKLDFDLDNKLENYELIGLLLYNQSVKNVNLGNIDLALELANKSLNYYNGDRVKKLISWLTSEKLYASL